MKIIELLGEVESSIRTDLKAYVAMLEQKIAELANRVKVLEEGQSPQASG
jgi:uncharacterized protein YceH (UPF0502 family)